MGGKNTFFFFFSQRKRRSLKKKKKTFVTEESKIKLEKNSPMMDGKALAITDNIPDSVHIADITHTNTHSTIFSHTFKTLAK